jgi:hypothetical protein
MLKQVCPQASILRIDDFLLPHADLLVCFPDFSIRDIKMMRSA